VECAFEEVPLEPAAEEFDGKIAPPCYSDSEGGLGKGAVERGHHTVAAAVETVGQTQDAAESLDKEPVLGDEPGKTLMLFLRQGFTVIAGDMGDEFPLPGSEAEQVGMPDQVVGVLVVARITDEIADVMEKRRRFEHLPILFAEAERCFEYSEDLQGQPGHLAGMHFIVMAGTGEFEHCVPPVSRLPLRGEEVMPFQSLQDQSFPDPPFVYLQKVRLEKIHQLVNHDYPGDNDVRPVRIQSRHRFSLLQVLS